MSRRQLTHKQHAFLEFLKAHVREQKVWPTYREIVDPFNYRQLGHANRPSPRKGFSAVTTTATTSSTARGRTAPSRCAE